MLRIINSKIVDLPIYMGDSGGGGGEASWDLLPPESVSF
jgi:hypothetical protein